jgi:MoaA/NifB/PqqE/SkfB family radical SAM enzyme
MVSDHVDKLQTDPHPLRMIAWEVTRRCNLSCIHCRASAEDSPYEGELTTQEIFNVMDDVACLSKPVIIRTGGEPLLRAHILIWHPMDQQKGLGWSWPRTGHCSMKKSSRR